MCAAHFILFTEYNVGGVYVLTGRQLYLLRIKDTNISDLQLSEMLGISTNDILIYEYGIKEIPKELYGKWESIIKNMLVFRKKYTDM